MTGQQIIQVGDEVKCVGQASDLANYGLSGSTIQRLLHEYVCIVDEYDNLFSFMFVNDDKMLSRKWSLPQSLVQNKFRMEYNQLIDVFK